MAVASGARQKKVTGSRVDPVPRPTVGTTGPKLKGRDPALHYVFVNPYDPDTGLAAYQERGYEPVLGNAGGARVIGGSRPGESSQTYRDQVLVAKPIADLEAETAPARERAEYIWEKRLRLKKGTDSFKNAGIRGSSGDEVVSVVEGSED